MWIVFKIFAQVSWKQSCRTRTSTTSRATWRRKERRPSRSDQMRLKHNKARKHNQNTISVDSQLSSNLYARTNLICWVGDFYKKLWSAIFCLESELHGGPAKIKLQTGNSRMSFVLVKHMKLRNWNGKHIPLKSIFRDKPYYLSNCDSASKILQRFSLFADSFWHQCLTENFWQLREIAGCNFHLWLIFGQPSILH